MDMTERQRLPFDYAFAEIDRQSILRHRQTVLEFVRSKATYEIDRQDPAILHFRERIAAAKDAGLFVAGGHPGEKAIIEMYGRIAYCIQGLHYDKAQSDWFEGDDPSGQNHIRSVKFLNKPMRKPNEDEIDGHTQKTFNKVDMALIAHSFLLPLSLFEIFDGIVFDDLLREDLVRRQHPSRGKRLIDCSTLELIEAVAEETTILEVLPDHRVALERREALRAELELADTRAVEEGSPRGPEPVPASTSLYYQARLPSDFRESFALLFEVDSDRHVTLLSSAHETANKLLYRDGLFACPRGDEPGGFKLGVPKGSNDANSTLMLVLFSPDCANHGVMPDEFSFYAESRKLAAGQAPKSLNGSQLEELRQALFRLPQECWQVLTQTINLRRQAA